MELFARSQYVRPAEMQWCQELSFQLMTEESGGESTEEITCYPFPWRSESKFKLMHIHMQAHKQHHCLFCLQGQQSSCTSLMVTTKRNA